jgi:hypothetical protein
MNSMRANIGDRRQLKAMPLAPFKDSNGATIRECRRWVLDRRTSKGHVE